MGISGLSAFINKHASGGKTQNHLREYSGKKIVIDTSIFLYRFLSNAQKYGRNTSNYLGSFYQQILTLRKWNITPIYIFDGKPPPAKEHVLKKRRDKKEQIKEKIEEMEKKPELFTSEEVDKVRSELIYITGQHIADCKELFKLMGVSYIQALGEADTVCIDMINKGLAYACISEDMDILACGGKRLLRDFSSSKSVITEYNYDTILSELSITNGQFIDFCILVGCDYTPKIGNIGPQTAYKLLKKYNRIEGVLKWVSMQSGNKYTVPEDFDYNTARQLFNEVNTGGEYTIIKGKFNQIHLENFMKTKKLYSNAKSITQNLQKYANVVKKQIETNNKSKNVSSYFMVAGAAAAASSSS